MAGGFLSSNPIARYGVGGTAGMFALSHAKSAYDSMRYGDMTTAALNVGAFGLSTYAASMILGGKAGELGKGINSGIGKMVQNLGKGVPTGPAGDFSRSVNKALLNAGEQALKFF